MKNNTSLSDSVIYFISGGLAAQIAWTVALPIDTMKSMAQTSDGFDSTLKFMKQTISKRGIQGLYVGIEAALLRAFPANGALFLGYELSKEMLTKNMLHD